MAHVQAVLIEVMLYGTPRILRLWEVRSLGEQRKRSTEAIFGGNHITSWSCHSLAQIMY